MRFRAMVSVRLMVRPWIQFRDMEKANDIVIGRVSVMVRFKVKFS